MYHCIVCLNKLDSYVCDSKLFSYQYDSLNGGPSLEVILFFFSLFIAILTHFYSNPQSFNSRSSRWFAYIPASEGAIDEPLPGFMFGIQQPLPQPQLVYDDNEQCP